MFHLFGNSVDVGVLSVVAKHGGVRGIRLTHGTSVLHTVVVNQSADTVPPRPTAATPPLHRFGGAAR